MQSQGEISDAEATSLLSQANSKTSKALQKQRTQQLKLDQLNKQKSDIVRHMLFSDSDDETVTSTTASTMTKHKTDLKKKRVQAQKVRNQINKNLWKKIE